MSVTLGHAFHGAWLSEVGGERLSAADTTDSCHLACHSASAVFARARGLSKMAVASCMGTSSGIDFRKRLSKSRHGLCPLYSRSHHPTLISSGIVLGMLMESYHA